MHLQKLFFLSMLAFGLTMGLSACHKQRVLFIEGTETDNPRLLISERNGNTKDITPTLTDGYKWMGTSTSAFFSRHNKKLIILLAERVGGDNTTAVFSCNEEGKGVRLVRTFTPGENILDYY